MCIRDRLYGMLNLNIGRLKAIRHEMSPSIGYNYKPDFSEEKWGFYEQYTLDSNKFYSYYDNFLFGTAPPGEQQSLSFTMGNDIQAKIITKDTTQKDKKIKIFDNLSFSQAYNFAADSLNLSDFSVRASASPIPRTSFNFSTNIDPYILNEDGIKINTFVFAEERKLGRFKDANLTVNTAFSSSDFKKKDEMESSFSWNVTASFSFRYTKSFDFNRKEFKYDMYQNLTLYFTVIPTPMWNISVRTGYDFNESKITSTTLNLIRDLHCWEMSFVVTPFGQMKSYMFKVNIKAPMFEALQIKRERSWRDYL